MNADETSVERGLQMLQDRWRLLGNSRELADSDRQRVAQQIELAREPWESTQKTLEEHPDLIAAIEDLWPRVLPYLIKGNEISPVHHIAHVVNFMGQICLAEVSPLDMRWGVLAALLHDIGIGDCALPKISEASIKRADPETRIRLRRDGIASRLEHMKLGVAISRELLRDFQTARPGYLTNDDVATILDIVGSHDYSKIPLMEDHVDRKWLLKPGPEDWLKQCHWEADALWMLTPAGILVDLEREKEDNTPATRQAKLEFNLGLHRLIVSLYSEAYSPEELEQFGFHDGLLYRSETGYGIARALASHRF
jgi:hypothetical protein